MNRPILSSIIISLTLLMWATPLFASSIVSPVFASEFSSYWYGFRKFWGEMFQKTGGVSMLVLAVGAISLIVIVFGNKWKK